MLTINELVDVKHHFICDLVQEEVCINYVCLRDQIVDIFTKASLLDQFVYLRSKLSILKRTF